MVLDMRTSNSICRSESHSFLLMCLNLFPDQILFIFVFKNALLEAQRDQMPSQINGKKWNEVQAQAT